MMSILLSLQYSFKMHEFSRRNIILAVMSGFNVARFIVSTFAALLQTRSEGAEVAGIARKLEISVQVLKELENLQLQ